METKITTNYHKMTTAELNRAIAKRLGYSIYDYHDINTYSLRLMDEDYNPVVLDAGLRGGERKTEEEAWADVPNWADDIQLALGLTSGNDDQLYYFKLVRFKHPMNTEWLWEAEFFFKPGRTSNTVKFVSEDPARTIAIAWLRLQEELA